MNFPLTVSGFFLEYEGNTNVRETRGGDKENPKMEPT